MSLAASLDSLNKSTDSIKSLYFSPSGVFTNALTLKPMITRLIRDAQDHESSLYVVSPETGDAKRADGSKGYLEHIQQEIDADEPNDDVSYTASAPVVKVPEFKVDKPMERDDYRTVSMLTKLHHEYRSAEELIEKVKALVSENRSVLGDHAGVVVALDEKRAEYRELQQEISRLGKLVKRQEKSLETVQRPAPSTNGVQNTEKVTVTAKELIAQEEQEIHRLELALLDKRKHDKEISESLLNE